MKIEVKKFGQGGLHAVIPKSSGYLPGDVFELHSKNLSSADPLATESVIRQIVRDELENLLAQKRGF